jgi:hypothetical protein
LKESVAVDVRLNARGDPMLAAIDLDDQAIPKRCKVENVTTNWRLLAEVES